MYKDTTSQSLWTAQRNGNTEVGKDTENCVSIAHKGAENTLTADSSCVTVSENSFPRSFEPILCTQHIK